MHHSRSDYAMKFTGLSGSSEHCLLVEKMPRTGIRLPQDKDGFKTDIHPYLSLEAKNAKITY